MHKCTEESDVRKVEALLKVASQILSDVEDAADVNVKDQHGKLDSNLGEGG